MNNISNNITKQKYVYPLRKKQPNSSLIDHLNCCYTNADQFLNKIYEFQSRLIETVPHIIGVTEVKPKNAKNIINLQQYNLDLVGDYNMFQANVDSNVRRGLILYIHKTLNASQVSIETEFQENIFVDIKVGKTDTLLVGLIYRSPSCDGENNIRLRELVTIIRDHKCSHKLVMGDFNYNNIDRSTWNTRNVSMQSEEYLFLENVRNSYFTQQFTYKVQRR